MSSFSIVQDVSLELRRQLIEALQNTPDTDFGIGGDLGRISLQAPGAELGDDVVASLYLYHLEIDPHFRNQAPLADRQSDNLFRKPPIPLVLRYVFTPVTDSEETNQLVLGRCIQHIHDVPHFSTVSGVPVGNSFGGASTKIRVYHDFLPLENLSHLWTASATALRTSVPLRAEVVAIDSGTAPAKVVRSQQVATLVGKSRSQR